jgi:hypothetical protein
MVGCIIHNSRNRSLKTNNMNKEKIQSSYYPEITMDINKWYKKYKVGSRCSKYTKEETGIYINDLYNHSKLFQNTNKFSFFGLLKSLKLVDL